MNPQFLTWAFCFPWNSQKVTLLTDHQMIYVATQFLTHVLINFQKNPKLAKTSKIKKYICFFNIFASFLAFSTSSQKNLNFQRSLERVWLLTRYFLKSLIFLIRGDVDKKIQKNKKNQIYKKRKLRDQFWGPSNIFTYKYWSPQHTREEAILHLWRQRIQNPKPKSITYPNSCPHPSSSQPLNSHPHSRS
jgi:hypothetical protein